jgi:putative ABC transport system ATP-binding protein
MSKILEVKNLTKVYSQGGTQITALSNVSFDLESGKSLAIVGPSGSGKTTLLELIAGLNSPTSGQVLVNGLEVSKGSDKKQSQFRNSTMGFVFQMFHLQDYFTASENVTLPLLAAGKSSQFCRDRSEELLKKVGLENRKNQYPKQLSGGEMQRVAIARALANSPKIILADEPTAKLDQENVEKVMEIFEQIQKEGVSILMITHDQSVASKFSNIIKLKSGKVQK